jgi:hypothetical protein
LYHTLKGVTPGASMHVFSDILFPWRKAATVRPAQGMTEQDIRHGERFPEDIVPFGKAGAERLDRAIELP